MGNSPLSEDEAWSRISSRVRYCLGLLEAITLRPPTMGGYEAQEFTTSLILGELITLLTGKEIVHVSDDPAWIASCRHFRTPSQCGWSSDLGLTQEEMTRRLSFWIIASLDYHSLLDIMAPNLDDDTLKRIVRESLVRTVMGS